jgi:iron complex outermembrane receptor protein
LEATSVRAQMLMEPTDRLSLRFGFDYTSVGGKGSTGSLLGFFSNTPGQQTEFTPTGIDIDSGACSAASNAFRSILRRT